MLPYQVLNIVNVYDPLKECEGSQNAEMKDERSTKVDIIAGADKL